MAHALAHAEAGTTPARRFVVREQTVAVLVIFLVAFAARLLPTLNGSGLFGLHFYDDGVHFGAAVGLVHGRLPYRDFLLLHPPGIVVILAPFAEIGRWISDGRGFGLARLAFMALGGVNAVLVSHYLRDVGRFAAWFGGLFYALFWPAVYSEHTVLLEGPANTCLLLALLLLTRRDGLAPRNARLLGAGALLGLAMTVKMWGVVPVLVLFGWLAVRLHWRAAWLFLLGAAASTTVVCLPFFLAAPRSMWQMVVVDQLQRTEATLPVVHRLKEIAGLSLYRLPDQTTPMLVITCVLLVLSAVAAAFHPRGRLATLLLAVLVTVLLLTPSWFLHYAAFSAPAVALVVGVAVHQLRALLPRTSVAPIVVSVALAVALSVFAAPLATAKIGSRFPGRTLAAAVADRPGCVTSDHPSALILMNVLSRNLERDCPLVVDLGGAAYHLPSPGRGVVSRRKNPVWQRYALDYLSSGDTVILARFYRDYGFSKQYYNVVWTWRTVLPVGRFTLRDPSP
ncbi:MAG TPA: glycosyltransferase 87 family protein [Propionibacteriaceae bacterium]|nr:glycosyltransferase 87 family protein [Propionibacteriaceae bacterium]